jgi:hypothetical protein
MEKLFQFSQCTGSAVGDDFRIRSVLRDALRKTSKNREQIAKEISQKVGYTVTVRMLNGYVASSEEGVRFPAAFVGAFCEVTGDDELIRFLMGKRLRTLLEFGERALLAMKAESIFPELSEHTASL